MEAFQDVPPIWDFSNAAGYPQMQQQDFMSLLDKQFPPTESLTPLLFGDYTDSIDPQNVNKLPLPTFTPPSEDSSPSPPNSNQDQDDADGSAPKRKAAEDSSDEGPSTKSQHTLSNNDKKSAPAAASSGIRRKSTGGQGKDEGRLLKRKEQNRAAQRAFRERKEKHVKDLEDKVAALEARNEEAAHENENLRDLLNRLQSENIMLKQSQFTFSMPREAPLSAEMAGFPTASSSRSAAVSPSASSSKSPKTSNPLDWSSLTTFDPSRLTLLDDLPQPTATGDAMHLDFGFGSSALASNAPYTAIASNPMFTSFASSFDSTPSSSSDSPNVATNSSTNPAFNFDMHSLTAWPTPSNNQDTSSLEDLLSGYLGNANTVDYSFLTSPTNASPITHHLLPGATSHAVSLSSSPSASSTDPLFTPHDAASPDSDFEGHHDKDECPRTKTELAKRIEASGPSPFAPACVPSVRKSTDQLSNPMITCAGSKSFPKTQKSEKNVELLTAWRSITANPQYKDTDISELCAEFTSKARCDGTKVVLEPSGVHSIMEHLSKKQHQQ